MSITPVELSHKDDCCDEGSDCCADPAANEECCPSVLVAPVTEEEAAGLATGFHALGDPARLRLLSLLAATHDGVCACDLVVPLGKSQSTVSHHLKALTEAGLIEGDRKGRWIWYRVIPEAIDDLRAALTK